MTNNQYCVLMALLECFTKNFVDKLIEETRNPLEKKPVDRKPEEFDRVELDRSEEFDRSEGKELKDDTVCPYCVSGNTCKLDDESRECYDCGEDYKVGPNKDDAICPECNGRNTNMLDPDENGVALWECYDCGEDYMSERIH